MPTPNPHYGKVLGEETLWAIMDRLVGQGAHNINLVNPTHFAHIVQKLPPLPVPVVWNSGGYDRVKGKQHRFWGKFACDPVHHLLCPLQLSRQEQMAEDSPPDQQTVFVQDTAIFSFILPPLLWLLRWPSAGRQGGSPRSG